MNDRNAVSMNSVRTGHISKPSDGQRNQFSSSRKSARRKTTSRRKSSSSDEANDIPNNVISALVHDECSTFADHLKMKLEKFGHQDRAIVMHKVNNIIFEAEMEKYGHRSNF